MSGRVASDEAVEALRGAGFDVELRASITAVYQVSDAAAAADCAAGALAAWGKAVPAEVTDGTWLMQVAETGLYAATCGWVRLTIRTSAGSGANHGVP